MSDMKKLIIGIIFLLLPVSFVACGIENRPEQSIVGESTGQKLEDVGSAMTEIEENGIETADTAASEPETVELLNWVGEYLDENGNVSLRIEESGTEYHIEISIFRLTSIDDGVGIIEGNKLVFTATDASGEPIRGEIEKTDNGVDVIFTDSTWEYIENGDRYSYWSK